MSSREMNRILALPVFRGPPPIEHGIVLPEGVTLRPAQDAALRWWAAAVSSAPVERGARGGLIGAGCGTGKTLVELLLPAVPGAPGFTETLYLTPARLTEQLRTDAYHWRMKGLPIESPTVESHESLSAPNGRNMLFATAPKVIVIDEAHRFGNRNSGRWRRIAEYIRAFPETVRLVILTGSLTGRSVMDWSHLSTAALRDWSPLPSDTTVGYWAAVCDPKAQPDEVSLEVVEPLVAWGAMRGLGLGAGARECLHERLRTAPGVTLTTDTGVDVSLSIEMWNPGPGAPTTRLGGGLARISAAHDQLSERWELPDGTQVESSSSFARHYSTLALGGWQRYREGTAAPEWLEARRAWCRFQRNMVEYQGRTYQTPGAVTAAMERGELVGHPARDAWARWLIAEHDYSAPETEWVWLPDVESYHTALLSSYADKLTASGHDPESTLVWVRSPAVGVSLARVMGAPYRGAGSNPPTGGAAVVSHLVHGTGWNTAPKYGYTSSLVVEPPSGGDAWEQLLSRLHRVGQTHEVDFHVLAVGFMATRAMDTALEEARYARGSTGAAQRLLDANWLGMRTNRVG